MSSGSSRSGGKRASRSSGGGLPSASEFTINKKLPKLEGSEKQIEYARKLRKQAAREMMAYAVTRTSDGRRSSAWETAQKGDKAIKDSIKNNPLIAATSGALKREKTADAVNGFRDAANRVKRFNTLFQGKTSAAFWIENGPSKIGNHLYSKFKSYIDGK